MNPFYQDNHNTIYCIDFRKNELPDESVQMVCTSPPYWGLRKYSGDQELIWGGDLNCEHQWSEENILRKGHPGDKSTLVGPQTATIAKEAVNQGSFCSLCGAWRGGLGLEPTPELYIQHTIEILREIRRVLRKDGVVFWNIGDSYASQAGGYDNNGSRGQTAQISKKTQAAVLSGKKHRPAPGLKPKDLCLIPFHVAIEAQREGWWVRSVIIWEKPNPMPESCKDRPTESHEYILMLTKSGTAQYWTHRDHEGTRKQPKPDYRWVKRNENIRGLKTKGLQELGNPEQMHGQDIDLQSQAVIEERDTPPEGWTPKNKMGWDRVNLWRGHDYYYDADAVREEHKTFGDKAAHAFGPKSSCDGMGDRATQGKDHSFHPAGRNLRSVWTFPTMPFPSFKIDGKEIDHFAVFPEKLPELCIKAATPEVGCCSKCGAPWARVLENKGKQVTEAMRIAGCDKDGLYHGTETKDYSSAEAQKPSGAKQRILESMSQIKETTSWQPTCKCDAPKVPSLVLDPMMGAGTTLAVAKKLNRYACGYELSQEYCELAVERCRQQVLL